MDKLIISVIGLVIVLFLLELVGNLIWGSEGFIELIASFF